MTALLEARGDLDILYALDGQEFLEPALGALFRLELGPERHRLCDYPEELLDLVECSPHYCTFRAVGPGKGTLRFERAEAGAWSSGRGSRTLALQVRAELADRPEPLRAPDICL